MSDPKENCIEWLNGEDTISVTLSQVKYINKVKKLQKKYPEMVKILDENKDGSIICPDAIKSIEIKHNYEG